MSTVSLRAFRRTILAKFFAASLIALIVSPITAPFSTISVAELLGETAVHVDHGSAKLVQEVIDLGGLVPAAPVLVLGAVSHPLGWAVRSDVRSHRSLVLRI